MRKSLLAFALFSFCAAPACTVLDSAVSPSDPEASPLTAWLLYGGLARAGLQPRIPRFLYFQNGAGTTLRGYRINPDTGALASLGADVNVGATPTSVSADPLSRFLYASSSTQLYGFAIDANSGALTPTPLSPYTVPGASNITGVAMHPTGAYLYVVDNLLSGTITSYSINASTGALTQLGASQITNCNNPETALVHPTLPVLYAGNAGTASCVSAHTIDGAGLAGAGVANSTGANTGTRTLAISGSFLFAPQSNGTQTSYFTIHPTTGALTSLGAQLINAGGQVPNRPLISPDGSMLYASLQTGSAILGFHVDAGAGALTTLPGAPYAAATNGTCLAMEPRGRFIYSANVGAGTGTIYSRDAVTGALSNIGGFATLGNPCSPQIISY